MADAKQPARKGTSRRMPVLAALLAVIAVVAVWLSDCIPGFGIGSSGSGDGQPTDADADKAEPAKSESDEPAKSESDKPASDESPPQPATPPLAAGKTLNVKIDVAGCAIGAAEPIECSKVCERTELFEGMDAAVLEVAGASHGSVIEMTDCLKSKGIDKVAIRRETP